MAPNLDYETALWTKRLRLVAGVDEVGRGPLAGPVMAAAVIIDPQHVPSGINDSKKLTSDKRTVLLREIEAVCHVGLGEASVAEIDDINILQASHLAMVRAIAALPVRPDHVLVDGNLVPRDLSLPATALVKGDSRSISIAAASIVAKTARDALMESLAQQWPGYGWETNKGYPTKCHKAALQNLGPTPHHRRSFKPLHNM